MLPEVARGVLGGMRLSDLVHAERRKIRIFYMADGLSSALSTVQPLIILMCSTIPCQDQHFLISGLVTILLCRWSVQELKAACLHAASGSPP